AGESRGGGVGGTVAHQGVLFVDLREGGRRTRRGDGFEFGFGLRAGRGFGGARRGLDGAHPLDRGRTGERNGLFVPLRQFEDFLVLVLFLFDRRGLVHHGRRVHGVRVHRSGRGSRSSFGLGFRRRRVVFGDDAADGGEDLLHRRFLRGLFGH